MIEEVVSMRNSLFYLTLLMAGCGGDGGDGIVVPGTGAPPVQHEPVISELALSPDSVIYMEGGGSVAVTAQVEFWDAGLDIQTLWVRLPDGTSIEFDESVDTPTGTLTEVFGMSTEIVGEFAVEFWLVDKAGNSSNHQSDTVSVIGDPSSWTAGDTDLPFVLNAVHWSGANFIAVGDGGFILTSPDGLTWTQSGSATNANLRAIGFDLFDHVAVGDSATVLGSADGGKSWFVQHHGEANVSLRGVNHLAWPIVAVGKLEDTDAPYVMSSPDHGQSWTAIEELPQTGRWFTASAMGAGLHVATTQIEVLPNDARVAVSGGGEAWSEVVIDLDAISTFAIIRDWDSGLFWAAGEEGRIYRSPDGVNWARLETPVNSLLKALAGFGDVIVAHGSAGSGVMTSDGGQSWQLINIGDDFESHGLAYGAGRFVAVGHSTVDPGKGAIYTAP
ncbi:MAG: hypothetical protein GWN47_09665 [Woeseiaceae bacterium]|nr:hypothetical protein [Woeseiaceae bacterium]